MLLGNLREDEVVALEDGGVGGQDGVVLPPPVDLGGRVARGIAVQLHPADITACSMFTFPLRAICAYL